LGDFAVDRFSWVANFGFAFNGTACPTGVPHCVRGVSPPRQICVAPICALPPCVVADRILCLSVVFSGTVQVKITVSPLRTPRKSVGGLGNSSDGGCGGAIDAHPASNKNTIIIGTTAVSFVRENRILLNFLPLTSCFKYREEPGKNNATILAAHLLVTHPQSSRSQVRIMWHEAELDH
jgi:hypothetical protein